MPAKVKIYTTQTCLYCRLAKEYFAKNNIEYIEINVAEDSNAANEMIEKTGQMGVPVIEAGNEIIVGFNLEVFDEVFKNNKK